MKAIIDIGASCQMKVVAEGVETPEQMAKLQQYHCDLLQGYYFDKPLSAQGLVDAYFPVEPEACVWASVRAPPYPVGAAEPASVWTTGVWYWLDYPLVVLWGLLYR